MCEFYREKTAITRKKPSSPVRWSYKQGIIESVVFDWGCGKGMDSRWLKEQGMDVLSYDPYFDNTFTPDCIEFGHIKTILLIDVLNIIEDRSERDGLISDVGLMSKPDTTIIISVPRIKSIDNRAKKSNWKSFADGFITKNKTFIKGYTLGDFADCCMKIGTLLHIKKTKASFVGIVRSE